MTDAEKKMLAALLHFVVDSELGMLGDDLVKKLPGVSGTVAELVWASAKSNIIASLDAEIDKALSTVVAKAA